MAQQVNVTILGLNRVGASFGMALKQRSKAPGAAHQFTIVGCDPDASARKAAQKLGAIDQEEKALIVAVSKADIVFVAANYGTVEDLFIEIGPDLKPGAVVIDASPLKMPSIGWAQEHFRRNAEGDPEAYLVGVTLIWGPEHVNSARIHTEAAQADLFEKGMMVLSPSPDCPTEAVQLVADLASLLELKVHFTDPIEHDGMMASMEGVPVLLQLAFFRALSESEGWKDLQKLGNPSFGLATYRLGIGIPDDYTALTHLNRENVLRTLSATIDQLKQVRDLIAETEDFAISDTFEDSMRKYEEWQIARRKNNWKDLPEAQPIAPTLNLLGPLGNLLSPLRGKKKQ